MIAKEEHPTPAPGRSDRDQSKGRWFTTTHWSVVLTAKAGHSPLAAEALEKLCRTYWPPLYAFIQRDGYSRTDAQDLTQKFFQHLLARDFLVHLKNRDGKFRSFLLTFLKHFLSDERDRAAAQKRGGDKVFISWDEFAAEDHNPFEPADTLTPDQIYEKRWAETIIQQALGRLRDEYVSQGKAELYDQLKDLAPGERGEQTYAELGKRFSLSESAIKSAMHRLRTRYQRILQEEIAQTVMRPEDVEEEIRYLIQVLAHSSQ